MEVDFQMSIQNAIPEPIFVSRKRSGVSGHGSCVCGCGGTPVPRHVRILNWVAPVDADAVSLAAVLVPPQGKVSLSTAGLTAKLQEPGTKCAS